MKVSTEQLRQKHILNYLNSMLDNFESQLSPQSITDTLISLAGKSQMSSQGFPFIDETSFRNFTDKVSHLFKAGSEVLELLKHIEISIESNRSLVKISDEDLKQLKLSLKTIRSIILTAGVTAPSDLWTVKHLLSIFAKIGLEKNLLQSFSIVHLAAKKQLDKTNLTTDVNFLMSRGIFVKQSDQSFSLNTGPQIASLFNEKVQIKKEWPSNWIPLLRTHLQNQKQSPLETKLLVNFLDFNFTPEPNRRGWTPDLFEIELGYRLMPIILSFRTLGLSFQFQHEVSFDPETEVTLLIRKILSLAGLIDTTGKTSELGRRVFDRGPGPFGIIHAYYPYVEVHLAQLTGKKTAHWVVRGENVAASQDANRKSFKMILDSLVSYCEQTGFEYQVFIEHAVGQGEATRQHFVSFGDQEFTYFGADLEDEAIAQSEKQIELGILPKGMRFIRKADIGRPELVISALKAAGHEPKTAVMVVGNGFHEVRNQTDDSMIATFKGYCDAGILLIFTEETGLTDEDLIHTAWNTYHAGFRYFHEISGQGLRPYNHKGTPPRELTWKECAENAGYKVLDQFTTRTRTIYPSPIEGSKNPSISVNYFCVPKDQT